MNVSKRTWILLGIAIIAILAAFASLYFEKEEEIKTLEDIEPEVKKPTRSGVKKPEDVKLEVIPNPNETGNSTEQN